MTPSRTLAAAERKVPAKPGHLASRRPVSLRGAPKRKAASRGEDPRRRGPTETLSNARRIEKSNVRVVSRASIAQIKLFSSAGKSCVCPTNRLNCLSAKEWAKSQLGVWRFNYERRDVRNKELHPAAFPISLAKRVIELFTHAGELVLDPFVGSGTTLLAAQDLDRHAVGFDLNGDYIRLATRRLERDAKAPLFTKTRQVGVHEDARTAHRLLRSDSMALIVTSPPYMNLLTRSRSRKSRRTEQRRNGSLRDTEMYSTDPRDLGLLNLESYCKDIGVIFAGLLPKLKPGAHCVLNVPDIWWENKRVTLHISVIEALRSVGYELRNTIIWDRTNVVNGIGIFGWPNNYITMGTSFEYLLDFRRPTP